MMSRASVLQLSTEVSSCISVGEATVVCDTYMWISFSASVSEKLQLFATDTWIIGKCFFSVTDWILGSRSRVSGRKL